MHNWHLTLTPYPLLVGIAMTAMILEISSSWLQLGFGSKKLHLAIIQSRSSNTAHQITPLPAHSRINHHVKAN